jgi:hypothetical protein
MRVKSRRAWGKMPGIVCRIGQASFRESDFVDDSSTCIGNTTGRSRTAKCRNAALLELVEKRPRVPRRRLGAFRPVLYRSKINASRREAWRRVIAGFDQGRQRPTSPALFTAARAAPEHAQDDGGSATARYQLRRPRQWRACSDNSACAEMPGSGPCKPGGLGG